MDKIKKINMLHVPGSTSLPRRSTAHVRVEEKHCPLHSLQNFKIGETTIEGIQFSIFIFFKVSHKNANGNIVPLFQRLLKNVFCKSVSQMSTFLPPPQLDICMEINSSYFERNPARTMTLLHLTDFCMGWKAMIDILKQDPSTFLEGNHELDGK